MPTRDVVFNIIGRDAASPAFAKAAASAESASARIAKAGEKISAAGTKWTHAVTLPLLAIGAAAIKSASDFNASMTRIQTQAGASAKDVQYLTKAVLGMKNVQQGPNDLATALYHLKSVGMANVEAMHALRQASDLAAVGGANLEDTTNALAGAWRTGITGAKNFHQAVSTINAIIGAGNMTLADFNAALGTGILPTAKTFGLTLKDVGSALALFTDEGIDSASAATRLRMSMSLLAAPSQAAEKVLNGIGLSGHQLGETLRKPNGLIQTIGLLKGHLEGVNNYYPNPSAAARFAAAMKARVTPLLDKKDLTAAQQALVVQYGMAKDTHEVLQKGKLDAAEQAAVLSRAFGGGRSSSAILSLVNNFDVLKKKQDQVTASLGKYNQAVRAQQQTPEAQFKERIADFEKAGVILGTDLLPAATGAAKELAGLAEGFNNLSPAARGTVEEIAKWAIIIGPTLLIGGKLITMFGRIGGAAKSAALFMAAPYRATEESAQIAALKADYANAQIAADEALTAAAVARAEAEKATAAEESAVRIAVASEDAGSALGGLATQAALDAIDFNAAMQSQAVAAQTMAADTAAAATAAQAKLATATAGVGRSVYGLQTAIGGLGIGLGVGTLTHNASTTTKVLGALGSAAAGAGLGFSMSGGDPIGAVIGGLAGGLSSLATAFFHTGHSANTAAQEAQAYLDLENNAAQDLLGTLREVNGQYKAQARQSVLGQLQKSGLLTQLSNLGINPRQLLVGAMGNQEQLQRIYTNIFKSMGVAQIPGVKGAAFDPNDPHFKDAQKLVDTLSHIVAGGADAERTFELWQKALGHTLVPAKLLQGGLKNLNKELTKSRDLFIDPKFQNAANPVFSSDTAEAARNSAVIQANIHQLREQAAQQLINHKRFGVINQDYKDNLAALEHQVTQMGFNKAEVDVLFGAYKKLPRNIVTQIRAEDHATAALKNLQNYIKSHTWTVDVQVNASGQSMAYVPGEGYINVGGKAGRRKFGGPAGASGFSNIPQGYFTVGERGWELGYRSGDQVSIIPHETSRAMTGLPSQLPGFANGTSRAPRKIPITLDAHTIRQIVAALDGRIQEVALAEVEF